jgi:hypothetical protein
MIAFSQKSIHVASSEVCVNLVVMDGLCLLSAAHISRWDVVHKDFTFRCWKQMIIAMRRIFLTKSRWHLV